MWRSFSLEVKEGSDYYRNTKGEEEKDLRPKLYTMNNGVMLTYHLHNPYILNLKLNVYISFKKMDEHILYNFDWDTKLCW